MSVRNNSIYLNILMGHTDKFFESYRYNREVFTDFQLMRLIFLNSHRTPDSINYYSD